MTILLVNNYHYARGGSEKVYFNTGRLLEQKGHNVIYYSIDNINNYESKWAENFCKKIEYNNKSIYKKITSVPKFLYNMDAYNKLMNILDVYKPDVAHIHLFMGGLTTSVLKALYKRNVPIVHTAHDLRMVCPAYLMLDGKKNVCSKCIDGKYIRCFYKKCSDNSALQSAILSMEAYFRKYFVKPIKYFDKIIYVSEFSRNMHARYSLKYSEKGEVLYNYTPSKESKDAISSTDRYYLYFGRLSREKGLYVLNEAARKTNIKLKIVGDGPLYRKINENISENIEILGYKKGEELTDLIRKAYFVILPSECYENNPLSIIEAYMAGTPVIASRIGGIPEIIEQGKTGYCFEPGNVQELIKVIKHTKELSYEAYAVMSLRSREYAEEKYSAETYYKRLLQVYKDAIKERKKQYE